MILLTGANHSLARLLLASLSKDQPIRAVDIAFDAPLNAVEARTGDLRDQAFVDAIVDGVDTVIHLSPIAAGFGNDSDTLDHATRGTYQLINAVGERGARVILGSTLDLFAPLWDRYRVDEVWRPQPSTDLPVLCAYLAEVATREVVRVTRTPAICLRFGTLVDGALADPRHLHVDDAVAAIRSALAADVDGWRIFHIASGDNAAVPLARAADEPLNFTSQHVWSDATPPQSPTKPTPIPARPIRNVVVFGAGGPLGSQLAEDLTQHYTVRLTDIAPAEELAQRPPQSPGAPLPKSPSAPHTWEIVDVRDADQVMAACAGMDAIINVSVVRHDPADAFRVNTLGAFNVMRAAVAHGIHRVVHTGPFMLGERGAGGYDWDDYVVDDVPARPGTGWVYIPSKLLGQEICRVFAVNHGLSVPTLTFCAFRNPDVHNNRYIHPLSVSWQDAARALRCAVAASAMPSPYEYMHIGADLPHGVFPIDKARRLLGWAPEHAFEELYQR
ncbi:MAG: NAD-dependent epimerase/dehydratase family protein [Caldilineaceae bacterium]